MCHQKSHPTERLCPYSSYWTIWQNASSMSGIILLHQELFRFILGNHARCKKCLKELQKWTTFARSQQMSWWAHDQVQIQEKHAPHQLFGISAWLVISTSLPRQKATVIFLTIEWTPLTRQERDKSPRITQTKTPEQGFIFNEHDHISRLQALGSATKVYVHSIY